MVVGYGVFVAGELKASFVKYGLANAYAQELVANMFDGTPTWPEVHEISWVK